MTTDLFHDLENLGRLLEARSTVISADEIIDGAAPAMTTDQVTGGAGGSVSLTHEAVMRRPSPATSNELREATSSRAAGAPALRRWIGAAAAALVVVGAGGLWTAMSHRSANTTTVPGHGSVSTPTSAPAADPAAAALLPPWVTIDQAGWALTRATDSPLRAPSMVVYDPARGFDGPWVSVGSRPDGMAETLRDPRAVTFGATAATLSGSGDLVMLSWSDAAGRRWDARGWQVDQPTITAIASALTTGKTGEVSLTSAPAGLVVAPPEAVAALGRYSEYEFSGPDGTTLQIRLYPGGPRAMAERGVGTEPGRSEIAVGNEQISLIAYTGDPTPYRANVLRGFWTWELDGAAFTSQDAFTTTVAAVRVIDEATWRAALPGNILSGPARAAAVDALLVSVPVPDGFVLGPQDGTADRSQLIVQTASAVTCAWLNQWFDATDNGDTTTAAAAAAALATSHRWPMLSETAEKGGFSDVVWEYADAVNGGPGIPTGGGPTAPTRASAEGSLGCDSR